MSLRYCFEISHVPATLSAYKQNDLAVMYTEKHENLVKEAVKRGVYRYLNKFKTEYSKQQIHSSN